MNKFYHIPGIGVFKDDEGGKSYHIPGGGVFNEAPAAGGSAALTGTATASIDESDVVTGGKTIILTLTGDTWAAAGTGPIGSTADPQSLIDRLDSAQTETPGRNNEGRDKEVTTAVVRTSSTVATITLTASAPYDITATETITTTIPAAALVTSATPVVTTPTFTVTAIGSGVSIPVLMHQLKNKGNNQM